MLHVVTPAESVWIVENIRERVGRALAERIASVTYDGLAERTTLRTGTYLFAGMEVITAAQRAVAVEVWTQLERAGPSVRLLNHPARVLGRYELLRSLHEAGRNDFRPYRPSEVAGAALRYPVFLREADRHTGSLTERLPDAAALETALRDLQRQGYARSNLLVVEYVHTADEAGVFRKYSAFRVGDAVVPRYLSLGYDWVVKENMPDRAVTDELYTPARLEEELEYLQTNPHRAWILETFERARIDYGRIDYGIRDGRLQAWEINTNPAFGAPPDRERAGASARRRQQRRPAKRLFYDRMVPALADLAAPASGAEIPIRIPGDLASRVALEARALRVIRQSARLIPKISFLGSFRRSVREHLRSRLRTRG